MSDKPEVLAILQNQWFKNPERVREIYASHNGDRIRDSKFRAAALFMGCLTGRRIAQAFGDEWRHRIAYEEASPVITQYASASPCFDALHIRHAMNFWKPKVVIAFGKTALNGLRVATKLPLDGWSFKTIIAPHPAARHPGVALELSAAAQELNDWSRSESNRENHGADVA